MGRIITINIDKSRSLLSQLRDQGYFITAWCGGRGNCGKCRVRFLKGAPEPGDIDKRSMSADELDKGWRLACGTYLEGIVEIELPDQEEEHIQAADSFAEDLMKPDEREIEASYALALDIGTTTIAACLLDRNKGQALRTVTGINHQRVYGADVLSRIEAANRGEGRRLQEMILGDLNDLCRKLEIGESVEDLSMPVIVSGNTTMGHLLQGLSCRGLGAYPFTPEDISMHLYRNMTFLPGISTYVGADIVSGIVACGIDRKEDISIFVDLGTNGEMLIGNKERILAASAAAGPAFEGGSISCGSAGVPGAIESVEIKNKVPRIRTIGEKPACGICGTGVLETVYELLKEGIIDETGLLDEEYFEQGFPLAPGITFTARDVREVQLAKSAIRAGIEILLRSYGISCDQVSRLYLAGGFGQGINCKKAVGIGMIPEDFKDRIQSVGNSSLEGAKMYAIDPETGSRFQHAAEISEEIVLSNHELFNDLYIEHMYFNKR